MLRGTDQRWQGSGFKERVQNWAVLVDVAERWGAGGSAYGARLSTVWDES
jgi:hypothetical protein